LRESLLLRIEGGQALKRRHRLAGDVRDRRDAGAGLNTIDQYRAGAALRQPAAEARATPPHLVHQHVDKRRIGTPADGLPAALDLDLELARHDGSLPCGFVVIARVSNGPPPNKQHCCLVAQPDARQSALRLMPSTFAISASLARCSSIEAANSAP